MSLVNQTVNSVKSALGFGGNPAPQPPASPAANGAPAPYDFSTLYTGEAPAAPEAINAQIYNPDPSQLQEQLKGRNFTPDNFNDLAAKATSGDIGALQELLNTSVQNAVAFATTASANLAENAAIKIGERSAQQLPYQVQTLQVDALLKAAIPDIMNNPAFAPQVENAKVQLLRMNPSASAEQIANLTKEYLKQFSTSINPVLNPEAVPKPKPAAPMSLTDFFRRV